MMSAIPWSEEVYEMINHLYHHAISEEVYERIMMSAIVSMLFHGQKKYMR